MKRQPKLTRDRRRFEAHVGLVAPESEVFTIPFQGRTVPVPWIASWSSEMPNFRVQKDPLIAGAPLALFRGSGKRGEGTPILGKMDVGRQRYCVLKGVCQVCAKPLIPHEMWLALLVDLVPPGTRRMLYAALAMLPALRKSMSDSPEPERTHPT